AREPGDVGARPGKARDEALADRVGDRRHDDRRRACRLLRSPRGGCARGNHGVELHVRELARINGRSLTDAFAVAALDDEVLALDITLRTQAFEQPLLEM